MMDLADLGLPLEDMLRGLKLISEGMCMYLYVVDSIVLILNASTNTEFLCRMKDPYDGLGTLCRFQM